MSSVDKEISIVAYDARFQADFKRLNEAWITQYFKMEEADENVLGNPEQFVIESGGEVFFAVERGNVIGTCALVILEHGPYDVEMAKMAVDPAYRGRGLGQRLANAVIDHARKLNARTIFLESNTILAPAIKLYRKLGFEEVERQPTAYSRGNIHMVLTLPPPS